VAFVSSIGMLASMVPSVHVPSVALIAYYLVVPGYALLRLVNYPLGILDSVAWTIAISLGLTAGFASLFQSFYPMSAANQTLVVPLVTLVASALSLRGLARRK